jgi:hypothetical protein
MRSLDFEEPYPAWVSEAAVSSSAALFIGELTPKLTPRVTEKLLFSGCTPPGEGAALMTIALLEELTSTEALDADGSVTAEVHTSEGPDASLISNLAPGSGAQYVLNPRTPPRSV